MGVKANFNVTRNIKNKEENRTASSASKRPEYVHVNSAKDQPKTCCPFHLHLIRVLGEV